MLRPPRSNAPTPLPPPPAPTAPDANPWTISSQPTDPARPWTKQLGQRLRTAAPDAASHPSAPRQERRGLVRLVPFAIFAAVIGAFVAGALEQLQSGDPFGAILPMLFLGIILVGWWRSLRRGERRHRR